MSFFLEPICKYVNFIYSALFTDTGHKVLHGDKNKMNWELIILKATGQVICVYLLTTKYKTFISQPGQMLFFDNQLLCVHQMFFWGKVM